MRIVTLCLVLLCVVMWSVVDTAVAAAGRRIPGLHETDPKVVGFPIEGKIVVAASESLSHPGTYPDGRRYLISGWTKLLLTEDLPSDWNAADISPYYDPAHDEFAYEFGTYGGRHSKWDTRLQIYKARQNGTGSTKVTTCTPEHVGLVPGPSVVVPGLVFPPEVDVRRSQDLKQLADPTREPHPKGVDLEVKRIRPVMLPPPRPHPAPPEEGDDDCINCAPFWSPDASMLAFRHCDPIVGEEPCDAPGFAYWVVNADGSNTREVAAAKPYLWGWGWSPDGSKLLYVAPVDEDNDGKDDADRAFIVDRADLAETRELKNVGLAPNWSPDGSQIVSVFWEALIRPDGDLIGIWVRLRLTDVDMDTIIDPEEPLWERFIPAAWLKLPATDRTLPAVLREETVSRTLWTCHLPKWSPSGKSIAFLGHDWDAVQADGMDVADGLSDRDFQSKYVQVHVLHVASKMCSQITHDDCYEYDLRWGGPNTFPSYPSVNVGTVRVTFTNVATVGRTSVMWQESSPALESGYEALSEVYNLQTSAIHSGEYEVDMVYSADGLSTNDVDRVRVMWYDAADSTWKPIEAPPTPAPAGIARGVVESGVPSLQEPVLFVVALTPSG